MTVLVTGTAGFIGSAVARRLAHEGERVVGVDNLNDYYDVSLKRARLRAFLDCPGYLHVTGDLSDRELVEALFRKYQPRQVVHLAAQAGVRYGAINPHAYVQSNLTGFLHILEGCRKQRVDHLVYASTSSVYGANRRIPYSEHESTEHPLTLYAATKKANEMMAHSYANLYGVSTTGLRFFTVYGPWGRPDMAPMLFAESIRSGSPIKLFNHGHHRRSFTYIDDIVEGVARVLTHPATSSSSWDPFEPDPASSSAPYKIYNIGHSRSVELLHFIELLEHAFGRKAQIDLLPLQPGDVPDTEANTDELMKAVGYTPQVAIEEGVARFAAWYRRFYPERSANDTDP